MLIQLEGHVDGGDDDQGRSQGRQSLTTDVHRMTYGGMDGLCAQAQQRCRVAFHDDDAGGAHHSELGQGLAQLDRCAAREHTPQACSGVHTRKIGGDARSTEGPATQNHGGSDRREHRQGQHWPYGHEGVQGFAAQQDHHLGRIHGLGAGQRETAVHQMAQTFAHGVTQALQGNTRREHYRGCRQIA